MVGLVTIESEIDVSLTQLLMFYSRTKVGLFYCGNQKVTAVLKKNCRRFYVAGTKFTFNKETLT